MKTVIIYFQNPEMCGTQGYWVREEGDPRPSREETRETGEGADGYIGGNGWPQDFIVGGTPSHANYRADRFVRRCLGLEGPYRWEYVDIPD